jgi:acetyltransferase-like isoleucine patch superfamily enzyme
VFIGRQVAVGDYSYINQDTLVGSGTIGRYCSIGFRCHIGMPEHPVNFISTSPLTYGKENHLGIAPIWDDYASPPHIGHDVWVASNAVVLQNVTIGNGGIVAAGAVVTKDVPPYAIVGGVPARVLKYRFTDDVIADLMESRWWDLPLDKLRGLSAAFAEGARGPWLLAKGRDALRVG